MNKAEFAKVLAPIVQNYSKNEQLMNAFKGALRGTNENNAFYSTLKDGKNLQTFAKLVSSKQINLRDDEDFEPLKTSSYWSRPQAQFVYTARILPEIRDSYPETYEKVFDGTNVLPAGLGGKPKNGATIWNAVEQAEEGQEPEEKAEKKETKVDGDKIKTAVQRFADSNKGADWNISKDQIPQVAKFVTKLLQSMK